MATRHLSERARKFLREVGSIVLGVLIALGIGEVADGARHRVGARRAMGAVQREMTMHGRDLSERVATGHCIERRLANIRSELVQARRTGRIPDIGEIGSPHTRPYSSAAWATALGGGETLFAPREVVSAAAVYFAGLENYTRLQEQEQVSWARLRALEGSPGPIDADLLAELLMTVEEARLQASLLNLIARQLWEHRDILDNAPHDARRIPSAELAAVERSDPLCHPLQVQIP